MLALQGPSKDIGPVNKSPNCWLRSTRLQAGGFFARRAGLEEASCGLVWFGRGEGKPNGESMFSKYAQTPDFPDPLV